MSRKVQGSATIFDLGPGFSTMLEEVHADLQVPIPSRTMQGSIAFLGGRLQLSTMLKEVAHCVEEPKLRYKIQECAAAIARLDLGRQHQSMCVISNMSFCTITNML